jgi:hypothetical protein
MKLGLEVSVKRLSLLVAIVLVAGFAEGATLVLKNGRHIEVTSLQQKGTQVIVQLPNGSYESYPLAVVDLDATNRTNEVAPTPVPTPVPTPSGPHSPFFGAQAKPGTSAVVVTDADVQHVQPEEEGAAATPTPAAEDGAQLVLVASQKELNSDGSWHLTATVANTGNSPVSGVVADIRLLDAEGKEVGSGSASLDGTLAPGQQGTITSNLAASGQATQVSYSFRYQKIVAAPAPGATPAPGTPGKRSTAAAPPPPAPEAAGYTVPPGSSPLTQPSNPMAVPNLTEPPIPPQVPRPTPAPQ